MESYDRPRHARGLWNGVDHLNLTAEIQTA